MRFPKKIWLLKGGMISFLTSAIVGLATVPSHSLDVEFEKLEIAEGSPWQKELESVRWLYERREYAMAKTVLERIHSQPQLSPEIRSATLLLLGSIARETKSFPEALVLFQRWKDLFPKDPKIPRVNFIMARVYRDMNVQDRAKEHFYLTLSSLVMLATRSEKREEVYDKRLARAATWELAETEYQGQNWRRANELFERFKIRNPEAEELIQTALYRQADCFYQMGREGKALEAYKTALAVGPFHPFAVEAWLHLIDLYGRAEEYAQQAQALEAFIWLVKNNYSHQMAYWQRRCATVLVNFIQERPEETQKFLKALHYGEAEADWSSISNFLGKLTSRMDETKAPRPPVKGDESWAEWQRKITQGKQRINKNLEGLDH